MTTFSDLQNDVLLTLHGYGLSQPRASFLTSSVDGAALSFPVNNAADMDMGLAEVGGELVFIESVDRSSNTLTISPDGRGYYGSIASSHDANTRVTFAPPWPRQKVKAAINDTILSLWPRIFGVAQAQFTYNPAQTTYALPADAEGVLAVHADTLGPSLEQQVIRSYRFNSFAPTSDWPTTATISLFETPAPGRTVTVTYRKVPSELLNDTDTLSAAGLRESIRNALVLGACADLVSLMDASRLPVDTSMADEIDDKNTLGLASRIGNQLQLRFEMEVEKEQARLRDTYRVPIVRRSR